MNAADFLGADVTVQIDRPLGSRHPRHGFVYPVNYGFVPGVMAPDGQELDAYVLGVFEPLCQFEARCIALIRRTSDADDKLILVPNGVEYDDGQIRALTEFQERFFTSVILRRPSP